jgi:hypothetical protein
MPSPPKQNHQESNICFRITSKLVLNYARSPGMHRRVKCDSNVPSFLIIPSYYSYDVALLSLFLLL